MESALEKRRSMMVLRGLLNFSYVASQPRFVPSRGVLMNKALVNGFVNQRNGRTERLAAQLLIVMSDSAPKSFDLGPKLTPVTPVDRIPLFRLSDPFFCRFVICHLANRLMI
jgi:hypothetical protein